MINDETLNLNMTVDIKCAGKAWSGNIRDILKISDVKLSEEFMQQPSIYAWFASLCEMAGAEAENKKFKVSVLKANTEKRIRYEFASRGEKTTENSIAAAVQTDDAFIAASMDLIESERQYSILRSLVRSLDQRKDMLIQLGVMKRQEMQLSDFGIDLEKVRQTRTKSGE
jgi:hypothetical protein